jgi:pimeloyl-ACP methyl ester carboxylesterase
MKEQVSWVQNTVTSTDGTTIAYEQIGVGPAIILISSALADRADTAKLAKELSESFTVINYDRRGRGKSTDAPLYSVEREIEDLEALLNTVGPAYLFGSSSGAALALDAAHRLGSQVQGLFLYEPPFIVDDSRPPIASDLVEQVQKLLAANRRSDAVRLFFTKGMGIPGFVVAMMRWLMPGWSKMADMAHTIPYDLAVLSGTQAGRPLPAARWASVQTPVLVMVGGKSEAFFHTGAQALADLLACGRYRSLDGRDHGAPMTAPKVLAAVVRDFFLSEESAVPASI